MKVLMELVKSHYWRMGIVGFGVCWFLLGVSYVGFIGDPERYMPFVVAVTFFAAAAASWAFVWKPCKRWLFVAAGYIPLAALFLRGVSITIGQVIDEEQSATWATLATLCITVLVFFLLWWFWSDKVLPWHEYHRTRCALEPHPKAC